MSLNLDTRGRVHLTWMFENQPELVRQLDRSGGLAEHLEAKNQAALKLASDLQDQGTTSDNAWEAANHYLLAPPDGPASQEPPPDPVPYPEQQEILRRLQPAEK